MFLNSTWTFKRVSYDFLVKTDSQQNNFQLKFKLTVDHLIDLNRLIELETLIKFTHKLKFET